MRKIKLRISLLIPVLPPTRRARDSHFQYTRKPARCQATTVLGVTSTSDCFHLDQNLNRAIQKNLWMVDNRRRGRFALRASNCSRKGQVFENEILAGAEEANEPTDQVSEETDHDSESYRTL